MRRRGFATFVAVVMIGTIALALLGLSVMVQLDARRTRDADRQAQVRQLLLAGQNVAAAELARGAIPADSADVQLPDELGDYQLTLTCASSGTNQVAVTIEAIGPETRGRQRVTYGRADDGWRVTEVVLLQQR